MFFLFFSHLGIGLLGCMLLVPYARLGRPFFTFNALLALAFLLLAAAGRWNRAASPAPELVACIALAALYVAVLRLRRNGFAVWLLAAAAGAGIAAIVREAGRLAALPQAA